MISFYVKKLPGPTEESMQEDEIKYRQSPLNWFLNQYSPDCKSMGLILKPWNGKFVNSSNCIVIFKNFWFGTAIALPTPYVGFTTKLS